MGYRTEIKIWSRYGHTPITNRGGAFLDLLLDCVIFCDTPREARIRTKFLIEACPHGYSGHYSLLEHPNQNIRDGFIS